MQGPAMALSQAIITMGHGRYTTVRALEATALWKNLGRLEMEHRTVFAPPGMLLCWGVQVQQAGGILHLLRLGLRQPQSCLPQKIL